MWKVGTTSRKPAAWIPPKQREKQSEPWEGTVSAKKRATPKNYRKYFTLRDLLQEKYECLEMVCPFLSKICEHLFMEPK